MSPRRRATNVAASVRARLSDLARREGVEFQLLLSEFAIERLLYRLGVSAHATRFVLKGATLFARRDQQPDEGLLGPWRPEAESSGR